MSEDAGANAGAANSAGAPRRATAAAPLRESGGFEALCARNATSARTRSSAMCAGIWVQLMSHSVNSSGSRDVTRIRAGIELAAYTRLTVPFPIADAGAALRLTAGRIAASVGWRDVRFLPVFGVPGRYATGPLVAVAVAL